MRRRSRAERRQPPTVVGMQYPSTHRADSSVRDARHGIVDEFETHDHNRQSAARPHARLSQRACHHRPAARPARPALAALRPLRRRHSGSMPDLCAPVCRRRPGPRVRTSRHAPCPGCLHRVRGSIPVGASARTARRPNRSPGWNTYCAACREWFANSAAASAPRSSSATTATSTTCVRRSCRFNSTMSARKRERRRMIAATGRLSHLVAESMVVVSHLVRVGIDEAEMARRLAVDVEEFRGGRGTMVCSGLRPGTPLAGPAAAGSGVVAGRNRAMCRSRVVIVVPWDRGHPARKAICGQDARGAGKDMLYGLLLRPDHQGHRRAGL